MAESIGNTNEQRSHVASGGNNNISSNALSRRKTNNGGDVTVSPKYNKVNVRGSNKDNQQQKSNRINPNNNHQREQRNGANGGEPSSYPKQKHRGQNRYSKNNENDHPSSADVFDDLVDDFEVYEIDEQITNERKLISGQRKKKNVNHLLNFQYGDRRRAQGRSYNSNYQGIGRWSTSAYCTNRQSFSKEQFLQANCQFVVQKDSIDFSPHYADPDLIIDWTHVEEVHLHSMQPLKCPICLSEPQAAKITRCGHVFCWPCLLHYLALSDKSWRKCPVCCESVYKKDIRSVRGIVSRSIKLGDWIKFRLMRRERHSALFYPRKLWETISVDSESEKLLAEINEKKYGHLLFVDNETLLQEIVERENLELLKQLEEDGDQPESCFIRQALEENNERQKHIRSRINSRNNVERSKSLTSKEDEQICLLPKKPQVVYGDAFDNEIEVSDQKEENEKVPEKSTVEKNIQPEPEKEVQTKPKTSNETQQFVYFYQADDIYHAYLNGFNIRILIHEFASYQQCPDELNVRVEAVETYFMTEELRSQFRSLSHLPLTCEFQLIEIRLHPPMISPATMDHFSDEIHRRRQLRLKKERMETRRQQRAELVEAQKLFSHYPPEMMYIPQPSFPVNSTNSMEEFPAMISSNTTSLPTPSASVQVSDENLSPPSGISFAQMLKQQAPIVSKVVDVPKKTINDRSISTDLSTKPKKKNKNQRDQDSDDDPLDVDDEYYASTRSFQSSFSLEEVFDRLKLVNGEENSLTTENQAASNAPTKKKNKRNKQVLFATGLGGQAKL